MLRESVVLPVRGEGGVAWHRLGRQFRLDVAVEEGFAPLRHLLEDQGGSWRANCAVRRQRAPAPPATAATNGARSAVLHIETARFKK